MQKNEEKNLKVMVRIKPEEKISDFEMIKINEDNKQIHVFDPNYYKYSGSGSDYSSNFTFDQIFPPYSSQEEVFKCAGECSIDNLMQGYNSTILAYG